MTRWTRWFLAAATTLAVTTLLYPPAAEARGRIVFHGGFGFRGFYGPPYYAYGCGFWGPCFGPMVGFNMGMAAAAGIGAVDVDVKPGQAEVWVDGKFMAEARDLDGSPDLLWLKEGPHHVVIYKGGYRSFDEEISLSPGQRMNLKVRLEKGDSRPPGLRSGIKDKSAD